MVGSRHPGALAHHGAGHQQPHTLPVGFADHHAVLQLVGGRGSRADAEEPEKAARGYFVVHEDEDARVVGLLQKHTELHVLGQRHRGLPVVVEADGDDDRVLLADVVVEEVVPVGAARDRALARRVAAVLRLLAEAAGDHHLRDDPLQRPGAFVDAFAAGRARWWFLHCMV